MEVLARVLAAGLSLNRVAFGLAYLLLPARAGEGWIGRAARDPATQVFARGHGARDIALGAGALAMLVRSQPRHGASRPVVLAGRPAVRTLGRRGTRRR
jgi:hypothetical protein